MSIGEYISVAAPIVVTLLLALISAAMGNPLETQADSAIKELARSNGKPLPDETKTFFVYFGRAAVTIAGAIALIPTYIYTALGVIPYLPAPSYWTTGVAIWGILVLFYYISVLSTYDFHELGNSYVRNPFVPRAGSATFDLSHLDALNWLSLISSLLLIVAATVAIAPGR